MESRLQAEQKKVHQKYYHTTPYLISDIIIECVYCIWVQFQVQQQKRLQKVQENLMSEEEKKKRRKLQKVRQLIVKHTIWIMY